MEYQAVVIGYFPSVEIANQFCDDVKDLLIGKYPKGEKLLNALARVVEVDARNREQMTYKLAFDVIMRGADIESIPLAVSRDELEKAKQQVYDVLMRSVL